MTTQSQEVTIALLKKAVESLTDELHEAKKVFTRDIEALQDERNRALKWGIMSLGTAVMGMAYWIFNQITGGHLK